MGILFPSEKKHNKNNSSDTNSFVFTSSDKKDDSSEVEYLYSMPNFVTKNIDAIQNDEDYTERFKITVEYEYSEQYAKDTVVAQSVEAGTPLEKDGTEVTLTVSRGSQYRKMPDLTGKDITFAKDTLYAEYIRYEVQTKEGVYGDTEIVLEQSIAPETIIDISEEHTVILYVAEPEPETSSEVSSEDLSWVDEL